MVANSMAEEDGFAEAARAIMAKPPRDSQQQGTNLRLRVAASIRTNGSRASVAVFSTQRHALVVSAGYAAPLPLKVASYPHIRRAAEVRHR
jgi:hypothetical protein